MREQDGKGGPSQTKSKGGERKWMKIERKKKKKEMEGSKKMSATERKADKARQRKEWVGGCKSSGPSLVEVESTRGGSDADMSLLHSDDIQVHQVSVHLPVAGRRVPATHGQNLQALQWLHETGEKTESKHYTYTIHQVNNGIRGRHRQMVHTSMCITIHMPQ